MEMLSTSLGGINFDCKPRISNFLLNTHGYHLDPTSNKFVLHIGTAYSSKVSSSFRFKVEARKAKSCIKLDKIFQPTPPLIPRCIEASFRGSEHAYRISTQPNLLRVVNFQIISIRKFSADVVGALQLAEELRPCKLSKLSLEIELCSEFIKLLLRLLHPQ